VFRDVALQREAEAARARLASIVATSADAIVSKSLDGIIRTWNAGAERVFGYAAAEVVGKSMVLLIPPDRLDEEREVLDRLKQGLSFERQQTVRMAKNGRRIPVSATSSPLRDPEGHIVGASTILRDITDIVAAQETLARSREELEHLVEVRTTRLREVIDELQHVSYAITHDMRAPLRAMGMFAQLLLEDATERGLSPETIDFSRRIVTAAGRLDALIQDALNYNRAVLQELPLEPVPLQTLLRGLLETYPNFHTDKVDIRIDGELPVVLGNTSLLTQCFSNLLGNAVKFVDDGVKPTVRVWAETGPSTARVSIQDNGIGIPRHAQSRLFGMFQKLDDRYEGNGVGLAIVRKVVERMGGSVGVDSDTGLGSRFWVDLPLPPKPG
jgi:PAS domain S-box-containing protein